MGLQLKKAVTAFILVIVVVGSISALILSQSLLQNNTGIADSFELRIKDMIPPNQNKVAFVRLDNKTLVEESFALYETKNLKGISEKEFLDLTNNYIRTIFQSGYSSHYLSVLRCQNTFYIITDNKVIASCTPTRILETYTPTVPSPSPSPSPTPDNLGFMGSSSVTITNVAFNEGASETISLTLKNTGTKSVTIAQVRINNADVTIDNGSILTYDAGASGSITIYSNWVVGNPYKFDLVDSNGQVVGSYQATAPS
jgi:hypothetical protein